MKRPTTCRQRTDRDAACPSRASVPARLSRARTHDLVSSNEQVRQWLGAMPTALRRHVLPRKSGSSGSSVLAGTEEKRRSGSGGRRWSVPFGGTAGSFGRSWAKVRSLVFGNPGRTEHQRREDPFDQRGADRGALLPPRGRLPKGSAPEPQLRHCRGRANLSSDAWERQETRPSPLNRLWRADEGDGDATAKRRKTRYRKSTWKEKTPVLAFG